MPTLASNLYYRKLYKTDLVMDISVGLHSEFEVASNKDKLY
jgi:hypothetical protein